MKNDKCVFDIGMHVGQDTMYYLKQGYKVIAVEANPILVENNKKKFSKYISSGDLIILNVGIADKEAVLPFYKNLRLSEWSSFDKALGSRNGTAFEEIAVPCVTTKSLFEKYGIPYYMKVDIEGYDYLCLLDIPVQGEKPKYVSCEASDISWLDILRSKGYTKFKLLSQGDDYTPIDLNKEKKKYYPKYLIIKNGIKLRLQKFLPFKHNFGSSGPFGETTKGAWISYEEAHKLFLEFSTGNNGHALNQVNWFDFHATF
jgi:FkbM family methyltransferase